VANETGSESIYSRKGRSTVRADQRYDTDRSKQTRIPEVLREVGLDGLVEELDMVKTGVKDYRWENSDAWALIEFA
jgi:hypothetical protein